MGLAVCVWSLVMGSDRAHATIQSNVFSGTLSLAGDISEFFDASGNPLIGVTVSNSTAPAIPGQPGTAGLAKSPMGVLGSQTGQYHPSGYNQRRVMAAYNPNVNGGTIYIGIDLPGGTGSAANPDYQDPLTCGGSPPCPNSTASPIQRGSIRPFDSDGNGEPQSIGRMGDGVTVLKRCNDVTANSIVDLFTCSDPSGAQGATDDPSNPLTDPGVDEDYSLSITFTNGIQATADFIEDNTTASGHARLVIGGTPGFGGMVSMNNSGIPLGYDVEFAITNVNAVVDPCTRLHSTVVVFSGSNGDGPAQGEDTEMVNLNYVLPATVQCEVLLLTNNVLLVTNQCGHSAFAGVNFGDTVEAQVVVTAGASNDQNLVNISVTDYIGGSTNTTVIPGPLTPGQSVTNTLGMFTCNQPGVHGVMAVVSAVADVTSNCAPISSECDSSFECCGMPGIAVEKLVACRPAGGVCSAAANYGKSATGTVTQAQNPAFCYSILVTNTGNVVLQLDSVVDNVLGDLTSSFPASLPAGGGAISYFSAAYAADVVNSVTVTGTAVIAQSVSTNVVATDNAMVHVVPASITCEKLVSTNGVDFSNHVSVLADGAPHNVTYEVVVTAGAQSPLANVTITDPILVSLGCSNPPAFSLAAGAQTNILLCTVPLACTSIGDGTNTISVSANVDSSVSPFLCALDTNGAPIAVNSTCSAVVSCIGTSSVTLVKEVICQPLNTAHVMVVPLDPYSGHKSATGVIIGGQCPVFSYRITVINNGQLALHGVTVKDPLLGGLLSFPGTLRPGGSATNLFTETLCASTINTATVSAIGLDNASVTATDNATVAVLNAGISCTKLVSTDGVNFASSASITQDGNPHSVIYQLTVQNTSDSGVTLTNFSISDPSGCLGGAVSGSLASGSSLTVLCTNSLNCANIPGGSLTNTATVSAIVDSAGGTICLGTNTLSSSCSAVVNCMGVAHVNITKEVLCMPAGATCSSLGSAYSGQKTASGVSVGANCPTFCYRIIIQNNGTSPLHNVSVTDPLFGGTLAGYPGTLAIGGSVTNFFSATICSNTPNTAVVAALGSDNSSVTATDSASVTIKTASISCTKLVSTDDVNFASSATILQDGNAHPVYYKLTIQNTSDSGVGLTGFTVTDVNGCLAGPPPGASSLASGSTITIVCTNQLNCATLPGGVLTNTATVSALVDSVGGTVCVTTNPVVSSCSAVVTCFGTPSITVTKNVLCQSGSLCSALGSAYDSQKTASGVKVGASCPTFCYRVIVTNNGQLPLHSVTVTDSVQGVLSFPGTLAMGASATNFYSTTLCANTANTVTATGVGSNNSNVSATDSASVTIKSASISCTKLASTDDVNFASSVSIPQDGNAHPVYYKLTIQNTSDSGVGLTGFTVTDVNGCLAGPPPVVSSLASGGMMTIVCTNQLNCASLPGGTLTNTATVSALVDSVGGMICVTTNPVVSSCSAVVNCLGTPKIAITKEVICKPTGTACSTLGSAYNGQKTASSFTLGSLCPTFCYRIIITNNGQLPLHNVVVSDPLFGGALPGYPSTLAVGASATNFFSTNLCVNTQNTATTSGVGSDNTTVTASDTANVIIGTAGLSCQATVSSPDDVDGVPNGSNVSFPANFTWHQVTFSVIVSTGPAAVSNVQVTADLKWGNCSTQLPVIPANTSTNVTLCTKWLGCDYAGEIFTNNIVVSGQVNGSGALCGMTTNGQFTVSSSCFTTIQCLICPTCMITGPSYVCSNNSNVQYSVATSIPGASVTWWAINDVVIMGPTNQPTLTVRPFGNPPIQYDVFVTVAANGCTNTCKEWVGVSPAPSCSISPPTLTASAGGTASFTVSPHVGPGVPTIVWTGPNGFTSNNTTTITLKGVQPANAGVYTVTITDGNGCMTSCQASLGVGPQQFGTQPVVSRLQSYWKTHANSGGAECATLLNAIQANGGKLDLGFVCLPTGDVNGDNVVDAQDTLSEALGILWGPKAGSSLCAARKRLAAEMIAGIANNSLLGTPSGSTLIKNARAAAACDDKKAILALTSELIKFNSSGVKATLPKTMTECSVDSKNARKISALIPASFCNGTNFCAAGQACQ